MSQSSNDSQSPPHSSQDSDYWEHHSGSASDSDCPDSCSSSQSEDSASIRSGFYEDEALRKAARTYALALRKAAGTTLRGEDLDEYVDDVHAYAIENLVVDKEFVSSNH